MSKRNRERRQRQQQGSSLLASLQRQNGPELFSISYAPHARAVLRKWKLEESTNWLVSQCVSVHSYEGRTFTLRRRELCDRSFNLVATLYVLIHGFLVVVFTLDDVPSLAEQVQTLLSREVGEPLLEKLSGPARPANRTERGVCDGDDN